MGNKIEEHNGILKIKSFHPNERTRYLAHILLNQWNTAGGYHILTRTGDIVGCIASYLHECEDKDFSSSNRDFTSYNYEVPKE